MCCAPGSADGYRAARASSTCKKQNQPVGTPASLASQWPVANTRQGARHSTHCLARLEGSRSDPPTLHVPACSLVSVQRTRVAGHCNYLSCTFLLPLLPPWLNVDTAISSGNAMKFMRIMLLDCGPPRLSELPEATVCPRRYYTRPRTTRTLAHELYPLAAANPTGIP